MKRFRPFRFDDNGMYETDNPIMIKALKRKFRYEGSDNTPIEEETVEEVIEDVMDEESIRLLAKERKIKSWHVKSIETLKEEMGV